ncbi:hypothetical protein AB4Y94_10625, partial [Glaciibacter sp. 2TAF33]
MSRVIGMVTATLGHEQAASRDHGGPLRSVPVRSCPPVRGYAAHRPHRSLPHRATPATVYDTGTKATPTGTTPTHDRVREDRIDKSGTVTLRLPGRLRHIGIGRTHAGTHVKL